MAVARKRPVENKYIGISLDKPAADLAGIARSFGVEGFGPVEDPNDLKDVLSRAVDIITREQRPVLVDVITANERGG